jgi:hypothetical protein
VVFVALAVAMTVHAAAGANEGATHGTRVELPAAMSPKVSKMKIRMNFEAKVITGTLVDSETARDFASLLPLTLTLKDYSGTEKISDLPRRLSTKGAPAGSDPSIGDIAYCAVGEPGPLLQGLWLLERAHHTREAGFRRRAAQRPRSGEGDDRAREVTLEKV